MTHLVNELDAVVTEAVDGLVRGAGGLLTRLDGYPDIKVVLRTDWTRDRVALVSGGGAGHEPAHAGFVGRGLLTAAVCGEIFASPSVDAVLAAILAVTGDAGCLVIVKNYTGDRLSFGLAVERARSTGLDVEMVVVGDDVALPDATQPRGLAGTLFVHKVAGARAESGAALAEVAAVARRVAGAVATLGVSLSPVAIPGRRTGDRIAEGRAELGLGIHGEPGAHTVEVTTATALVGQMVAALADRSPEGPLAVLLNNLGGVAALEMGVVLRDLLRSELGARTELLVGPSALMSSLAAQGFSISVLPLDQEIRALLTQPVGALTAWPGARSTGEVAVQAVPERGGTVAVASQDDRVRAVVAAVCAGLIAAEESLNALDARVGDGDTGSTFATAARRIQAGLDDLPLADPAALLSTLSDVLATSMGGSSGVLGSIFFAAAGTASGAGEPLAEALHEGLLSMQRHGGAEVGDRTMLDALAPAIHALRTGAPLREAAAAAQQAALRTAGMSSARAGRSAQVPAEHLTDVQDPGAAAVAVMVDAAAVACAAAAAVASDVARGAES